MLQVIAGVDDNRDHRQEQCLASRTPKFSEQVSSVASRVQPTGGPS